MLCLWKCVLKRRVPNANTLYEEWLDPTHAFYFVVPRTGLGEEAKYKILWKGDAKNIAFARIPLTRDTFYDFSTVLLG